MVLCEMKRGQSPSVCISTWQASLGGSASMPSQEKCLLRILSNCFDAFSVKVDYSMNGKKINLMEIRIHLQIRFDKQKNEDFCK